MSKSWVETFTDGIIEIVTTLLVLELPQPGGGSWSDLFAVNHKLVVYFISFVALATYWNNHHNLFKLLTKLMAWFCGRTISYFYADTFSFCERVGGGSSL